MEPILKLGWFLRWFVPATALFLVGAAALGLWIEYDRLVRTRGILRPSGEPVRIPSGADGRAEQVHATVGQSVREGALLVTLDRSGLEERLAAARGELGREKQELDNLSGMIGLVRVQGEISIATRALELSMAQATLEQETRRSNRDRELAASELAQARREVEALQADMVRALELSKEEIVPKSDVRRLEREVERARAHEERCAVRAKADDGSVALARKRLSISEKALEAAEKATRMELEEIRSKISGQERRIEEKRGQVRALERELSESEIRAPAGGTVTWLSVRHAGEWIGKNSTVALIAPDGSAMVMHATVSNADIGAVRVGQTARLAFDAFPRERFGSVTAHVIHVAPDASESGADYAVVLSLEKGEIGRGNDRGFLRLGLTGQVEIVTGRERWIEGLLGRF
jgi:HlyD family secretion protein